MLNLDKKLAIGLGLFTVGGLYYLHSTYLQMEKLKSDLAEARFQNEIVKLRTMLDEEKEQREFLQKELDECRHPKKFLLPPIVLPDPKNNFKGGK